MTAPTFLTFIYPLPKILLVFGTNRDVLFFNDDAITLDAFDFGERYCVGTVNSDKFLVRQALEKALDTT